MNVHDIKGRRLPDQRGYASDPALQVRRTPSVLRTLAMRSYLFGSQMRSVLARDWSESSVTATAGLAMRRLNRFQAASNSSALRWTPFSVFRTATVAVNPPYSASYP